MPWTSGVYARKYGPSGWQNDKAALIKIKADRHDLHDQDLADGINACLTRDNTAQPTASFLPSADGTLDLGSAAFRWRDLFSSRSVNVYNGANKSAITSLATVARALSLPDADGVLMVGALATGYRNKFINGDMRIDQLNSGGSLAIMPGDPLVYTVDQWYSFCTSTTPGLPGSECHGQQQFVNGVYSYKFTGVANLTGIKFGQRIEAANCSNLAGKKATLSVKMNSSSLTSIPWAAYYANSSNAFGTAAAPTRTLISSGTFTVTAGVETQCSATFDVPAAATTGIEIVFSIGALTGGLTWEVKDAQLEEGASFTGFDRRDYESELARCQRYYEVGTYSEFLPISNASVTQSYLTHVDFKVTKFAAPTVTGTNSQGGVFATSNLNSDSMAVGRSDVIANRGNTGTYAATARIP